MDRNGKVIIHPQNFFSVYIVIERSYETAGWRRTFVGPYARERSITYAWNGIIPHRQAEQNWGGAAKSPISKEYKNPCIDLIDNDEWQVGIIVRVYNPICKFTCCI